MKGLLIKEFLVLKQYVKIFIGLTVFFILIAFFNENLSALGSMIVTLPLIISINSYSSDTLNRWFEFSACFPFTRKKLVEIKYLFMLLLTAIVSLFVLVTGLVCRLLIPFDLLEFIISLTVLFSASLILLSILAPMIYKYGIEKSRYFLMLIVLIPFLLMILFGSYLEKLSIQPTGIPTFSPFLLALVLIAIGLGIFYISYHLSAKIFEQKDL